MLAKKQNPHYINSPAYFRMLYFGLLLSDTFLTLLITEQGVDFCLPIFTIFYFAVCNFHLSQQLQSLPAALFSTPSAVKAAWVFPLR
jgi:hypothetical protein